MTKPDAVLTALCLLLAVATVYLLLDAQQRDRPPAAVSEPAPPERDAPCAPTRRYEPRPVVVRLEERLSGAPNEQRAALESLASGSEAFDPTALARSLDSRSFMVAQAAAYTLARVGGDDARALLKARLGSSRPVTVMASAHGLAAMSGDDPLASQALLAAMTDPSMRGCQGLLATVVGQLGTPDAIGALTALLLDSSSLRIAAAGLAHTSAGVTVLLDSMTLDLPLPARQQILESVALSGDSRADDLVVAMASSPTDPLYRTAIAALGHIESPGALVQLSQLARTSIGPPWELAVRALGEQDSAASAAVLVSLLEGSTSAARTRLLPTLASMRTPEASRAFAAALRSPDGALASDALDSAPARALATLSIDEVPDRLRTRYMEAKLELEPDVGVAMAVAAIRGPDPAAAMEALRSLYGTTHEAAVAALQQAARSKDASIRSGAVHSLGGMRALPLEDRQALLTQLAEGEADDGLMVALGELEPTAESREALISAIKNSGAQAAESATYLLANSAVPGRTEALVGLAREESLTRGVRASVMLQLSQLSDGHAPLLELARDGSVMAIGRVGLMGNEAVPLLAELARGDDATIARAAISGLGSAGTTGATESLVQLYDGAPVETQVEVLRALSPGAGSEGQRLVLSAAVSTEEAVRLQALQHLRYGFTDSQRAEPLRSALLGDGNTFSLAVDLVAWEPGQLSDELLREALERDDLTSDHRAVLAQALRTYGGRLAKEYGDRFVPPVERE